MEDWVHQMSNRRASEWICQACTFSNSSSDNACLMCEGIRPADTAYRETLLGSDDANDMFTTVDSEENQFDESPPRREVPEEASVASSLDNISVGIMLGALGGAGLALLRGRSITSGALTGAGYGAVGGMLMNQSDRMNGNDRNNPDDSTARSQATDGSFQSSSFSSYTRTSYGGRVICYSTSSPSDFFFGDNVPSPLLSHSHRAVWNQDPGSRGMGSEDLDMSYENLLALFGSGNEQTPATERLIDSLPSAIYSDDRKKASDESTEDDGRHSCSICIEEYEAGEEISTLPCLHMFHRDCINRWLRQCNSCPICKITL